MWLFWHFALAQYSTCESFLFVRACLRAGAPAVRAARDRCPGLVQEHRVHQWLRPSRTCHPGEVLPEIVTFLTDPFFFFFASITLNSRSCLLFVNIICEHQVSNDKQINTFIHFSFITDIYVKKNPHQ